MQKVKEGEGREGRKVEETSSGGRETGKKMRSLAPVRGNREKMRSLTSVRGIRGKMYYTRTERALPYTLTRPGPVFFCASWGFFSQRLGQTSSDHCLATLVILLFIHLLDYGLCLESALQIMNK